MGGGEVHQDQVGVEAFLQHAGLLASALGSGTADGGHHQHSSGGQLGRVTLGDTLAVGSLAHHFEHVQVTGFHSTVGTQSHIDTGLDGGGDGGGFQAVLGICAGGHHSGGLLFAQNGLVFFREGSTACCGDRYIQQPVAVQQLCGGQTGTVQAVFRLRFGGGQMQLHTQAFICTVVGNAFPQLVVTDVLGIDAAVHTDAAIFITVPLLLDFYQLPALLIGLKVKLFAFVDEAVGGKGHIALHAGLSQSFCGGIGVVVQVGHRGNAKTQALSNAQKGGSLGAAAVELTLLLQLLGQSFGMACVIQIAAQNGGSQMGVAVHQTGHGHHAGAVHDSGRLSFRQSFTYVRNFTVFHSNVCAE